MAPWPPEAVIGAASPRKHLADRRPGRRTKTPGRARRRPFHLEHHHRPQHQRWHRRRAPRRVAKRRSVTAAASAAPAACATPDEEVDDEQHEQQPADCRAAGACSSRLTTAGVLLGLSLTPAHRLAHRQAVLIGAFYAGGMLLAYTAPIWVLAHSC